jgi:hypothetical protein
MLGAWAASKQHATLGVVAGAMARKHTARHLVVNTQIVWMVQAGCSTAFVMCCFSAACWVNCQ